MDRMMDLERKLVQLSKKPEDAALFNEIGVILYQMKDWENAELYLNRAYQMDSEDQEILYNYAFILYLNDQWGKAIPVLEACLKRQGNDTEIIKKLGASYYLLGNYKAVAETCEKLEPEKGDLMYELGETIKSLHDNTE